MAPSPLRYQPLGPIQGGEGSRAFLGLEILAQGITRPIVLVWLPDELARDAEVVARVRRDTARAGTLEHPNSLKVYGFESLEQGHARVVEYADGENLQTILDAAQRVPPRIAARLVADAAAGVHFAQQAGNEDGTPLVHGDLRP